MYALAVETCMELNGTAAYVKYNRFHIEHRPQYVPDPFRSENCEAAEKLGIHTFQNVKFDDWLELRF